MFWVGRGGNGRGRGDRPAHDRKIGDCKGVGIQEIGSLIVCHQVIAAIGRKERDLEFKDIAYPVPFCNPIIQYHEIIRSRNGKMYLVVRVKNLRGHHNSHDLGPVQFPLKLQ